MQSLARSKRSGNANHRGRFCYYYFQVPSCLIVLHDALEDKTASHRGKCMGLIQPSLSLFSATLRVHKGTGTMSVLLPFFFTTPTTVCEGRMNEQACIPAATLPEAG